MNRKPKVLVVGSLVMDLIVSTERFPDMGETVIGNGFNTAPGGKGANQAVQAARLGADVTMVGMVGEDDFGRQMVRSAQESGVNTQYIFRTCKAPTAIGNVQIQKNENGTENRIIVVPGANFVFDTSDVEFLKDSIGEYDIVILQHEIPSKVNIAVAKYAKIAGVPVMLNPAPSAEVPQELLECLSYISPNEHEAFDITGVNLDDESGIQAAVKKLRDMGVENALITLGKNGCVIFDGRNMTFSPSFACGEVVDPTAAGDSFIGAFCTAIAGGVSLEDALRFANCTAGITVTKMGAQTSLPVLEDVLSKLEETGHSIDVFNFLK